MDNWVIRHMVGQLCYPYTGIEDQLKMLNVLEIRNNSLN